MWLPHRGRVPCLHLKSKNFVPAKFPHPPPLLLPTFDLSWGALLSAAVMVGRANWTDVFRHGPSSDYEFVFRLALVATTLQERPLGVHSEFACTPAFRALDPSEKGALSYFTGLTFCLTLARRWLDVPALMHLDIYRNRYGVVNPGRSRPDLFGRDLSGRWLVFESKGRTSTPSATDLADAKTQAGRATHVGTHGVLSGIALASYFTDADALRVRWEDPDPKEEGENLLVNQNGPIRLGYDEFLRDYYRPIIELAEAYPDAAKRWAESEPIDLPKADVSVQVFPKIWRLLQAKNYLALAERMPELANGSRSSQYELDGVRVTPGPSWSRNRPLPGL